MGLLRHPAFREDDFHRRLLKVPASILLALDGLEKCLEVTCAETARAVTFDHLEEDGGSVDRVLGEDLEKVALFIFVDEDPVPLEGLDLRGGLGDTLFRV